VDDLLDEFDDDDDDNPSDSYDPEDLEDADWQSNDDGDGNEQYLDVLGEEHADDENDIQDCRNTT